jgi:Zn-finger nucleic acid-binding protein
MHEHRYAGAPGVIVDECFACRGIFLDPGELGLIRAHFASLTRTAGIDTDPLTAEPVWSQRIAELEEEAQTSEELTALCRELMKRLRPFGV